MNDEQPIQRMTQEQIAAAVDALPETTRRVYYFILRYKHTHDGVAPATLEIIEACGLSSTSLVARHIGLLESAGLISTIPKAARGIMVEGGRWVMMTTDREHVPAAAVSIGGNGGIGE